MRFVFIVDRVQDVHGGIERHADALAAELRRRGHVVESRPPKGFRTTWFKNADWAVFDGVHRAAMRTTSMAWDGGPPLAMFSHGSFLEEAHRAELERTGTWRPGLGFRARLLFDRTLGPSTFRAFQVVFALSESERVDLVSFLGCDPQNIAVQGPFLTPAFLAAARAAPSRPAAGPPYVCAVSRIDGRKNFPALIEALDGTPYRFVLAGQDRGGLDDVRAAAARHASVDWEYRGEIDEAAKVRLIRGAAGVVVPSLSEGVPAIALEALVLGRPVVLAGLAYGPDHPGVVRCGSDAASVRRALLGLSSHPKFAPLAPPTVEAAADGFLTALGIALA